LDAAIEIEMIARVHSIKEQNIVLPLRVRGAHDGIKPGVLLSLRSRRKHKAWGAASEASKPQDRNPKRRFSPQSGRQMWSGLTSAALHRFGST